MENYENTISGVTSMCKTYYPEGRNKEAMPTIDRRKFPEIEVDTNVRERSLYFRHKTAKIMDKLHEQAQQHCNQNTQQEADDLMNLFSEASASQGDDVMKSNSAPEVCDECGEDIRKDDDGLYGYCSCMDMLETDDMPDGFHSEYNE